LDSGVSIYLVAIAKKPFMLQQSLYEILQILSISIFERIPIIQLFQLTQLQYFKEKKINTWISSIVLPPLVISNGALV